MKVRMNPGRNQPCPCGSGKKYKHCCADKLPANAPGRPLSPEQAIQQAGQHYVAGQLQQAEAICRQVLAADANHPNALHLLGVIALNTGHPDAAIELIGKAATIAPNAEAFYNLATAHQAKGDEYLAVANYRHALALDPAMAAAHLNLGLLLHRQARLAEAASHYQNALTIDPALAAAHNNLGSVLLEQGRTADALACFQRALALMPDYAEAHANAALTLMNLNRLDESLRHGREAVRIKPDFAAAHNNLGSVLHALGQYQEALECFERALVIVPDYAEACSNLSATLHALNRLVPAKLYAERALTLKPDYAMAHYNLGNIFQDETRLDEAIRCYEMALGLDPNLMVAYSNMLFTYNYHPDKSADFIFACYQEYARRYAKPSGTVPHVFPHDPERGRKIRVGYFSPDFREHSLTHFIEPALAWHDHEQFEIHCYANSAHEDAVTARLRTYADRWHNISGLSDEAVVQLVREEKIDILVDLAGHTSGGRLMVFAQKAAPVQATYLGYFMSTGLTQIDYFISDEFFTPPGSQAFFSETLCCLSGPALCYRPPATCPEVARPPAEKNGYVTFGCFSRALRLNDRVIALWSRILQDTPGARLVLNTRLFADTAMREEFQRRFARHGISPDRLDLIYTTPQSKTWESYAEIDIALDPFPHNAGTTSFESLWMGVPLISLEERVPVGRFGSSILHHLGLTELLATTPDAYLKIATELARNTSCLARLRAELRPRMAKSPLCDEQGFTHRLENAYRDMWKNWQDGGRESWGPENRIIRHETGPE